MKSNLIINIFKKLAKYGIHLQIFWSNNILFPSCKTLKLSSYTNCYKNYTYRLKMTYVSKEKRKKLKSEISYLFIYSTPLNFILKPPLS